MIPKYHRKGTGENWHQTITHVYAKILPTPGLDKYDFRNLIGIVKNRELWIETVEYYSVFSKGPYIRETWKKLKYLTKIICKLMG